MEYLKALRSMLMNKLLNGNDETLKVELTRNQAKKLCAEIRMINSKESKENFIYEDTDSLKIPHKDNIKTILECFFPGYKEEIIEDACKRIINQECRDFDIPKSAFGGLLEDILMLSDYIKKNIYTLSYFESKQLIDETDSLCKQYMDRSGCTCDIIIDWNRRTKPYIERIISGFRVYPVSD